MHGQTDRRVFCCWGVKMKKVIVTGANGFIGTALLWEMSKQNIKIYAVIKDKFENIDHIKDIPGVEIVYCSQENIFDLPKLINERDIEVLIHLAWAGSFGDLRADYNLQLLNVKNALDTVCAMEVMGIKRFVGVGTLAEKDVLNYHLEDGANPSIVSIYGIAKLSMQLMTKAQCNKMGIEHVWCYLSNTYGIGNTTNNFVNMVARKILGGEEAAFSEATQLYDFVYVTDTVNAIYSVAERGEKNKSYYLGSGDARPLREYIYLIRDAIDPSYPLHLGKLPFHGKSLGEDAYSIEKLKTDTGFSPKVSFEEGIKKTIAWLKKEGGEGVTKI